MFRRLFLLAEINNFTPEEREQYYKSLESMGDYYNIINTTAEEAEKRGLERGREEGREQEKIEMARKLKAVGVSIEAISQASGLSIETIESL